eukprot:2080386-Rhodomonas_salina.1
MIRGERLECERKQERTEEGQTQAQRWLVWPLSTHHTAVSVQAGLANTFSNMRWPLHVSVGASSRFKLVLCDALQQRQEVWGVVRGVHSRCITICSCRKEMAVPVGSEGAKLALQTRQQGVSWGGPGRGERICGFAEGGAAPAQ